MKGRIIYIEGHAESTQQANDSLKSFISHGWDVELHAGVTPKTVSQSEHYNKPLVPNGRLDGFKKQDKAIFDTKMSCFTNHINFWEEVAAGKKRMCFFEHDSICVSPPPKIKFSEYLLLNCDHVFKAPSPLALSQFLGYEFPEGAGRFPISYPLKYYKDNVFKFSDMAPGTAAYALTPKGARRLLDALETHGLDQSDFFINSMNVDMDYISPAPVKFNSKNLKTSHGF